MQWAPGGATGLRLGPSAAGAAYGHPEGLWSTVPAAKPGSTGAEARRSLSQVATLSVLGLYSAPVVLAVQLGSDPDGAFWLGRLGLVAYLVPAIPVGCHLWQLAHFAVGGRSKIPLVISALGPGALLCLVGAFYMFASWRMDLTHFGEECSHPDLPWEAPMLQAAYEEARLVLEACTHRLEHEHGGADTEKERLLRAPTLHTCWEYQASLSGDEDAVAREQGIPTSWFRTGPVRLEIWRRELAYMATLEADQRCAGFCAPGPPLWRAPDALDMQAGGGHKCSPFVRVKLGRLGRVGSAIFWSSLASAALFGLLLVAAQPMLARAGFS